MKKVHLIFKCKSIKETDKTWLHRRDKTSYDASYVLNLSNITVTSVMSTFALIAFQSI
ncbi:uncharacterized protein LOC111110887 isoform X2 [Crassostrea virginica]